MHTRFCLAAVVLTTLTGAGVPPARAAAAQPTPADPSPRAETPYRLALLGPAMGTPEADSLAVRSAVRLGADAVVAFEPTAAAGVTVCDGPGTTALGGVTVVRWTASGGTGARGGAFSTQDLERLAEAISGAEAGVVLVAVDHAWWGASAEPGAWNAAHGLIAQDPRVAAVVAVGDGIARDDGERDGVRYVSLPPRSGIGPRGLDHFARPSVVLAVGGPDRASFTMIEAGAVRGVGSWPGAEADDAIALGQSVSSRGFFAASPGGGPAGSVTLTLRNPTDHPVRYALGLAGPEGWVFSREEVSGTLAEHATESIEVSAVSPELSSRPTVEVRGQLRMPLSPGGEQAVPVSIEVPVRPEISAEAAGAAEPGAALRLDARSGVILETADLSPPLTIECWVRADDSAGAQTLLSAAGLELVWTDAAGLAPSPSVVVAAASGEPVRVGGEADGRAGLLGRWVHLAACFDDASATLFVDGVPVATREVSGGLKVRGPMVVGGIADDFGRIRSGFAGLVDEVRVSTVVRYDGPFTPSRGFSPDERTALLLHFDRAMGPVFADDSPSRAHGWGAGRARVESEAPSP